MTDWRGIPEEYRNQIVTGDARELAKRIPDESVDLIFTDPPYPIEAWRPVIVYVKPPPPKRPPTLLDARRMFRDKKYHAWGQGAGFAIHYIDKFTSYYEIIFEPFTGGGTVPAVCKMLSRNYIAFEIDPDAAEVARKRVRNTQPPLFVPQPEQLELIP